MKPNEIDIALAEDREKLKEILVKYLEFPDNRTFWGNKLIMAHHETINILSALIEDLRRCVKDHHIHIDNLNVQMDNLVHIRSEPIQKPKDESSEEAWTIQEFIDKYPICAEEHLAHMLSNDFGMASFCARPRRGKMWFIRPKRTLYYLSQMEHNGSVKRNALEFLKKILTPEEYERDFKGCGCESQEIGPSP